MARDGLQQLQEAFAQAGQRVQAAQQYTEIKTARTGFLNDDDTIHPDPKAGLADGLIWVRFDEGGDAVRVKNQRVSGRIPDLAVDVGRHRVTEEWEIIGANPRSVDDLGAAAGSFNTPDVIGDLRADFKVLMQRLSWFRLAWSSAFTVNVEGGYYVRDDAWTGWDTASIDLASHQPSDGQNKVPVLVGITSGGALTATAGTEVSIFTAPTDGALFTKSTITTLLAGADDTVFWTHCVPILGSDSDLSAVANRVTVLWPAGLIKRMLDDDLFVLNTGDTIDGTLTVNGSADEVQLTVQAHSTQTADLEQFQDSSGTVLERTNHNGYRIIKTLSAPPDTDLGNSEMVLWLDDTGGAAKLMIKAKDSAGTVVTGSVTLT